MRLTLDQHYEAVSKFKNETQKAIDAASKLYNEEKAGIENQMEQMNVLSFAIVGAILALNSQQTIDNLCAFLGMCLLIANAFLNFVAQDNQKRINRDHVENIANKKSQILREFLDVWDIMRSSPNDENEALLDIAGERFLKEMNAIAFTKSTQGKYSKIIGKNGYFGLYAFGLFLIAFGFLFPVSIKDIFTPVCRDHHGYRCMGHF